MDHHSPSLSLLFYKMEIIIVLDFCSPEDFYVILYFIVVFSAYRRAVVLN